MRAGTRISGGRSADSRPLPPIPSRRLTVGAVGRAVLHQQWQRVLDHETGTRAGLDPEELHKMRVATRRMRAAFSIFDGTLGLPHQDAFVRRIRALAGRLGAVRDLDVLIERFRDEAAAADGDSDSLMAIVEHLQSERAAARATLIAHLDGPDIATLQADISAALWQAATEPPVGDRPLSKAAPRLLARRARQVLACAPLLVAPTGDELHRLRIRCKRLRYTAEFLAPYASGRRLKRLIRVLTTVQDVLGDLHDGDVMLDVLYRLVGTTAESRALRAEAVQPAAVVRLLSRQAARRSELLVEFRSLWGQMASQRQQWRRGRFARSFRRVSAQAAEAAAGEPGNGRGEGVGVPGT